MTRALPFGTDRATAEGQRLGPDSFPAPRAIKLPPSATRKMLGQPSLAAGTTHVHRANKSETFRFRINSQNRLKAFNGR